MTDDTTWSWDEMLDEFRRLGGVADNIRPGAGTNGDGRRGIGPGIFPVDSSQEVRIYVPPRMLVPAADVRLENGALVLAPDSAVDPSVRGFFERFQAQFGFGAGADDRARRFLADLATLPDPVKEHLRPALPPDLAGFGAPDDPAVLRRFLRSRVVEFNGQAVLATLPELVNHAVERPFFDLGQGVRLSGTFDGEVLTRHSGADAWDIFLMLGIAAQQVPAFSIPIECRTRSGRALRIARRIQVSETIDGMPVPRLEIQPDAIVFSHVLLGHRLVPGLARAAFRRVLRDNDSGDADEAFDLVSHINRTWFIELLRRLGDLPGSTVATMREAALCQLMAMSHAVGAVVRAEKPAGPQPN